ncbi:hypothetical protein GCM10022394_14100 [Zobellella aerophila]|uniref:EpsG family protein n=2 Tax=Zobellella aerophila TaxID=870480 RepID=A0ABP6VKU6_9GAMM
MLIAMVGLNESIVAAFIPKDIVNDLGFGTYFDSEYLLRGSFIRLNYVSGFRLDFAFFTIIPLIVVLYVRKKTNSAVSDDIIKIYCLLSISYFLLCFIPYADRLAAFSWFLIPYLLYLSFSPSVLNGARNYLVTIAVASYALLMLDYNEEYFQWLPF